MTLPERFCISNTPNCSGLQPCAQCWNIIRTVVVPRTMAQVGGPLTERGSAIPALFIAAFMKAWGEAQEYYADLGREVVEMAAELDTPALPVAGEVVGDDMSLYRKAILVLPEDRKAHMRDLIRKGELPGYEELSEGDRMFLSEVLSGGDATAPETVNNASEEVEQQKLEESFADPVKERRMRRNLRRMQRTRKLEDRQAANGVTPSETIIENKDKIT
jgi:hypothetical protein